MMFLFFLQLTVLFGVRVFKLSRQLVLNDSAVIRQIDHSSLMTLTYALVLVILFYTCLVTCLVDVGSPRQRSGDALLIFATFIGYRLWIIAILSNSQNSLIDFYGKHAPVESKS